MKKYNAWFFSNFGGMRLKSEYIFLPANSNLFKQHGHYQGIIYDIWHKGCISHQKQQQPQEQQQTGATRRRRTTTTTTTAIATTTAAKSTAAATTTTIAATTATTAGAGAAAAAAAATTTTTTGTTPPPKSARRLTKSTAAATVWSHSNTYIPCLSRSSFRHLHAIFSSTLPTSSENLFWVWTTA